MMRLLIERTCRVAALVALGVALWSSVRDARGKAPITGRTLLTLSDSIVADSGATALQSLMPLARAPRGDSTVLSLGAVPSARFRAALGALAAGGAPLQWVDRTQARGLAVSASRGSTPDAPLHVRASMAAGQALVLHDAGGTLDSVATPGAVMAWQLRSAVAPLVVQQGQSRALITPPDSARAQRALVIAQPGWEGKFVVAALEEAGWAVDGSMRVSPSGSVTIGTPQRLDLSRYAAVVVLDSMPVDGAAITAFVSRGGGLVLGGDALRIPALAALRPARATSVRGAIAGALLTAEPRRGLEAWELEPTAEAVVLQTDASDHGHGEPALVATRRVRGRVVAMPYRETWRWRMEGTDDGAAEHRRWWQSALLAAVPAASGATVVMTSDAAARGQGDALPGAAAPYADLMARIGPPITLSGIPEATLRPRDERASRGEFPRTPAAPVLLGIAVLALLAEWTSRRLRGAR